MLEAIPDPFGYRKYHSQGLFII